MTKEKTFWVYLTASRINGTLYLGVTSDLIKRIWQHKHKVFEGFSADHGVDKLVWFEQHANAEAAITREKQIKKWNRAWKIRLIAKDNPQWLDLYDSITR
jgi:putative endonuclease